MPHAKGPLRRITQWAFACRAELVLLVDVLGIDPFAVFADGFINGQFVH